MNFLNKVIKLLFLGVFIFIIVLIAFLISFNVVPNLNEDVMRSGIVAFFGAFFAFIFVKIAEWFSIIRKSNENHFNSLVKIERLLNRIISRFEKNILIFQDYVEPLRSMKMITWSSHPVPFCNELADDLKNIDFINEYFSFSLDMETLNNDFTTIRTMYDEVKGLFMNGTIKSETYKSNVSFCVNTIEGIAKLMKSYQENAIKLLAKTRLLLKERKNRTFLFGAFPKKHYIKKFDKNVEEKLKVLKEEIEEVRKKSKEEINRIKGDSKLRMEDKNC